MPKPPETDYPAYFKKYIDLVPDEDLYLAFRNQLPAMNDLLKAVTEERSNYAYAEGKWTFKEVLQHIIDTERIFNYRALCFARKEKLSLPGFDENEYAANSNIKNRTWKGLSDELMAVRRSTELLFGSFSDETLSASGLANNNPATVSSVGFIILGHFYHHKKILEERYF